MAREAAEEGAVKDEGPVRAELARDPDVEQVPVRGGASALDAEPGVVSGWDRDAGRAPDDALDAGPVPFWHAEHCRREGAASMD